MHEIALLNTGRYGEAADPTLRPWLGALLAELAPRHGSLGVRFAGDRTVRQANRVFRAVDKTTDVLSFPGDGGAPGQADSDTDSDPRSDSEPRHLGDILISVPVARRQAAAAGDPPQRELRRLLLHGVLHCLGYDHETDDGEMERLERRLRRRWLDAAPLPALPAATAGVSAPPRAKRRAAGRRGGAPAAEAGHGR